MTLNRLWFVGFEGEEGGEGDLPKTYTEEEFNTHMAGLRRKYESQLEETKKTQKELASQLEKTKSLKGLSTEERTALETRITDLESQYMTDKEKSERRAKEEAQRFTEQIEGLSKDRDRWRRDYQSEIIRNQISRAAEDNNAHRAVQIEAIIDSMIEFKEMIDEENGGKTGEVRPVVIFPDIDTKTKKPIKMEYTIPEAVKRMTELEEYANLFKDTQKAGLGGTKNTSKGGRGKVDPVKLAKENPAEYRRLRKESPELLYGS